MRYYKIDIGDGALVYESFVNGQNDPGALLVELDVPVTTFTQPFGLAYITIWGISLKTIGQASDLNNKKIKVYAGMQKGLPLANPKQAGLIVQGYVLQAFGNWIGTTQNLCFNIAGGDGPNGTGSNAAPKNIVVNWKTGQPLGTAIAATLSTAFPGIKQSINIGSNLVLPNDEVGPFNTLEQLATYVKSMSKMINKDPNYVGVDISLINDEIKVYDGNVDGAPTAPKQPTQIAFTDLIGQPTWIGPQMIQTKTVMRADLAVGDPIKLPKSQATTTSASLSQYRQNSVFQGQFQIATIHHVGNSRQPDANAWITTIDAFPTKQAA